MPDPTDIGYVRVQIADTIRTGTYPDTSIFIYADVRNGITIQTPFIVFIRYIMLRQCFISSIDPEDTCTVCSYQNRVVSIMGKNPDRYTRNKGIERFYLLRGQINNKCTVRKGSHI